MKKQLCSPVSLALGTLLLLNTSAPRVAVADAPQPAPQYADTTYGLKDVKHPIAAEGTTLPVNLAKSIHPASYEAMKKLPWRDYNQKVIHARFIIDRDGVAKFYESARKNNFQPDKGFLVEFHRNRVEGGVVVGKQSTNINSVTVFDEMTGKTIENAEIVESVDKLNAGVRIKTTNWEELKGHIISVVVLYTQSNLNDRAERYAKEIKDQPRVPHVAAGDKAEVPPGYTLLPYELNPKSMHYEAGLAELIAEKNLVLSKEWDNRTSYERIMELADRYKKVIKVGGLVPTVSGVIRGEGGQCGMTSVAFQCVLAANGHASRYVKCFTGDVTETHGIVEAYVSELDEPIAFDFQKAAAKTGKDVVRLTLETSLFSWMNQQRLQFDLGADGLASSSGLATPFGMLPNSKNGSFYFGLDPYSLTTAVVRP